MMNVANFLALLQQPSHKVSPEDTALLEKLTQEFPYFQAAHALYLKGLKSNDSYQYNDLLKRTAALTADRDVLFDYITSDSFLQHRIADTIAGNASLLHEQDTTAEEVEPNPNTQPLFNEEANPDTALPQSAQEATQILDPKLFQSKDPEVDQQLAAQREAAKKLELGKPLSFTKSEKHSFTEWLQLAASTDQPEEDSRPEESTGPADNKKRKKKFQLIDKFIANQPKIVPQEEGNQYKVDIKSSVKLDKTELMTETLARVYLEQKKYKKAIQAYKILSLKYPEKSGFFADRIKAVKKLQHDNS